MKLVLWLDTSGLEKIAKGKLEDLGYWDFSLIGEFSSSREGARLLELDLSDKLPSREAAVREALAALESGEVAERARHLDALRNIAVRRNNLLALEGPIDD